MKKEVKPRIFKSKAWKRFEREALKPPKIEIKTPYSDEYQRLAKLPFAYYKEHEGEIKVEQDKLKANKDEQQKDKENV